MKESLASRKFIVAMYSITWIGLLTVVGLYTTEPLYWSAIGAIDLAIAGVSGAYIGGNTFSKKFTTSADRGAKDEG